MPDTFILSSTEDHIRTSALMRRLIDDAAENGFFTFGRLISNMPTSSFGIIGLVLSLLSCLPVIDIPARIFILIILCQMMMRYEGPVLPQRFLTKEFPSRYLMRLDRYAIPALCYFEKIARPRWPVFMQLTQRGGAFIIFVMTVLSLLPIPLFNLIPALLSVLIALAYLENDGKLLSVALLLSIIMVVCLTSVFYGLFAWLP